VTVIERRPDREAAGLGIVLSEKALAVLARVDPQAASEVREAGPCWEQLEIRGQGRHERFNGDRYVGIARGRLLEILRARSLARDVCFAGPDASAPRADVVVAADGVGSGVREADGRFGPSWRVGQNHFAWLGCERSFPCQTFLFSEYAGRLWCAHAYPFASGGSTFIVECSHAAAQELRLDCAGASHTVALCEEVFADHLRGASLVASDATRWQRHRTLHTRRWLADNVVLVGDAAHGLHFSIGVGTRAAMEDGLALADALSRHAPAQGLRAYELDRSRAIERLCHAAVQSEAFFERVLGGPWSTPYENFVLALMMRSGQVASDRVLAAGSASFRRRVHDRLQVSPG
jgi:anthraniloyl-CoA monooxygenase